MYTREMLLSLSLKLPEGRNVVAVDQFKSTGLPAFWRTVLQGKLEHSISYVLIDVELWKRGSQPFVKLYRLRVSGVIWSTYLDDAQDFSFGSFV